MADLTTIPGLFRFFSFKLVVVFDAFSSMPLAAKLFEKEPSAKEIANLVRFAAGKRGAPVHFVSDRGSCFTARLFSKALVRLNVRRRFGAIGRAGSIALIERMWRTLKESLALKRLKPLLLAEAQRRVELGLIHYAYFRPHSAHGGATPAEIYFGLPRAHLSAIPPPRGRRGQAMTTPEFEIVFLDLERRLPVLVKKAA